GPAKLAAGKSFVKEVFIGGDRDIGVDERCAAQALARHRVALAVEAEIKQAQPVLGKGLEPQLSQELVGLANAPIAANLAFGLGQSLGKRARQPLFAALEDRERK